MDNVKHDFILDMSQLLMSYGFSSEEAIKEAEKFYESHKNKIKDTLATVLGGIL
jgi:uncharacterized protein YoaH (UPF0181 family)